MVQGCDLAAERFAELLEGLPGREEEDHAEGGGWGTEQDDRAGPTASHQEEEDRDEGAARSGNQSSSSSSSPLPSPSEQLGTGGLHSLMSRLLAQGLPSKAAAKEAAKLVPGLSRKEAYAAALRLRGGGV